MLDRRFEPRMMCADMVTLRWEDDSGKSRDCTAILEDISPSGACLQLDGPLNLGTVLNITYHKGSLQGEVCYCFFREIGYWIGVAFAPKGKWSQRTFRPKHLLNMKK